MGKISDSFKGMICCQQADQSDEIELNSISRLNQKEYPVGCINNNYYVFRAENFIRKDNIKGDGI